MNIFKFSVIALGFIFIAFTACREVEVPSFGCTDIDSPRPNFDVDYYDSTCVYMYVTEFEISYFEDKNWDFGVLGVQNADLQLLFGDSNMDTTFFTSLQIDNIEATEVSRWVAHNQFKLKNQQYRWELHNRKGFLSVGETDELMTSGTLNPLEFSNDSVIVVTDSTLRTQLKIRYDIR